MNNCLPTRIDAISRYITCECGWSYRLPRRGRNALGSINTLSKLYRQHRRERHGEQKGKEQ